MVADFCRDHGLFLDLRRGLPRVRLRRPRRAISALTLAGVRGPRDRGGQPLQALQRLRHPPGLPGHPQRARCTRPCLRMAQGRLSAPGLAQIVARRRARARARLHARRRGRSTRSGATSCSRASPRSPASSCASPRAPSTSSPGCPCATARTSRAWLLTDFQQRRRHGDGRARARASTRRRASGATRCASPTCSKAADLRRVGGDPRRRAPRLRAGARPRAGGARGRARRRRRRTSTCPPRAERRPGPSDMPDPIRVTDAVIVPGAALAARLHALVGPRRPEREQGRLQGRAARGPVTGSRGCARTRGGGWTR